MLPLLTCPKVGDRVKSLGKYPCICKYVGTIIFVNKKKTRINILRDDKQQGGGKIYFGKKLWISIYNKISQHFGESLEEGTLYSAKIIDWKTRLK